MTSVFKPSQPTRIERRLALVAVLVLIGAVCLMVPTDAQADQSESSQSKSSQRESSQRESSQKALPWYVPSHAKLQYAGNIGWLSAGAGYTYLDDILQTELSIGFVPAFTGSDRLFMTTLKQLALPYEFELAEDLHVVPVYGGAFATYTFGSDYYVFPPEHLEGVYSRQTALRFGPLVGGRIRADIEPFGPIETLGAYWEFSANDLALNAYFKNPEFFSLYDVLALGLGVQVGFK